MLITGHPLTHQQKTQQNGSSSDLFLEYVHCAANKSEIFIKILTRVLLHKGYNRHDATAAQKGQKGLEFSF